MPRGGLPNLPQIATGERVYVVAHGKLRGYAPLVRVERSCRLRPEAGCLVRRDGAVAVTLGRYPEYAAAEGAPRHTRWVTAPAPLRTTGFRGWRYVWWPREAEVPFPDWKRP